MKYCIPWLLAAILVVPAEASERTPFEQAREIKSGATVSVTLTNGQTLKGRLGAIATTEFILDPLKPGSGPGQDLLFQDVSKIRERGAGKRKVSLAIEWVVFSPFLVISFLFGDWP